MPQLLKLIHFALYRMSIDSWKKIQRLNIFPLDVTIWQNRYNETIEAEYKMNRYRGKIAREISQGKKEITVIRK